MAIGTAQFGMPYGISNQAGQTPEPVVSEILACARSNGLDTLDTAIAYGESERVLGRIGVSDWKLVSKIPAVPPEVRDIDRWVRLAVEESLDRLGVSRLHGLLLHDAEQLTAPLGDELARSLERLASEGLTDRVGISIYEPDRLSAYLERFSPGLVQAPMNILDRRLTESGWLERLGRLGIEVHTRSCFLQGLLLMSPKKRPGEFSAFRDILDTWEEWRADSGLSPIEACLGYCLQQSGVHRVVVGVESLAQLETLLGIVDAPLPSLPEWSRPPDPRLLNPALWKTL